jgi:ATP/maltotriose-dependent transcriptional regulator MalT
MDVPGGSGTVAVAARVERASVRLGLSNPGARDRLAEASRKPLALVLAPAGFGKTTLLREFAAHDGAVFIDLAAGEPTFRDAVRMICEALRHVAPGARLAFASAYARALDRGQRTTALALWLARYLEDDPTTIVVASVDSLRGETAAFAEFVETLVRDGSRGVRVVIGAREDADLPIPRWFARDLITLPVGADDLRWTAWQARRVARRLGLPHDGERIAGIVAAADGRAFDVAYALRTGLTPAPGADPGETLFGGLPPAERAFVLATCLMPFLGDRVLVAAGLGTAAFAAMRSRLGDLAVRSGDDGYRYDDALRARAAETLRADDAEYRRIAERTVDALEAVGHVREALSLALTARLAARAHALLREHGCGLEDRGDVDVVEAALDVVTDDLDDAMLLLLRATRESRLGRTDTSEAWFRHAIARAESRAVSAEAAYRLAREIVRRGRSDAVELLEPYAHDETLAVEQRAAILAVLAEAYLVAHRPDDARAALRSALDFADRLDIAARAHLFTRASYVELYAGDREPAREYATTGADLADAAHLYVVATGAYSVLYNVAYDDAGPAESLVYLQRLGDAAVRSGNIDFLLYAIVAAYELQVELGDIAAVERLERDLREFDVHYGASAALEGLLPSRAVVAAWKGDFAAAYQILAPSGPQQSYADREALRWAEIALYAAAAGMHDAAAEALREFGEALMRDDSASQHVARAEILAGLASSLIGAPYTAIASPPSTGRLRALARAVDVVIARRSGAAGAEALLDAFDDLKRHEMAGLAKLFAALPAAAS